LAYRRIRKINFELAEALAKKNVLLKEVNHRVKNNMQTVTSLLEIESGHLEGAKEKEVFRNSINRIHTLALAHQNLYSTDNYTSIDLGAYLETLASHVVNGDEYSLKLDLVKDCKIDIEKAQAVGFILNELMTNSIKYAWGRGSKQEKIISLRVNEDKGELHFHYADNGKGMKENAARAGSIGISLIRSFVKRQLNGTLAMYNESGSNTLIKFSKDVNL
jgi:two-component sensor histidine kinase